MSKDVNIRYSDSDLAGFKKLINEKINKAKPSEILRSFIGYDILIYIVYVKMF